MTPQKNSNNQSGSGKKPKESRGTGNSKGKSQKNKIEGGIENSEGIPSGFTDSIDIEAVS